MIIPSGKNNTTHKEIVLKIIPVFCKQLLSRERDDRVDYTVRHDFLSKLAYFILNTNKQDIKEYLKPFIDNFNGSEAIADLWGYSNKGTKTLIGFLIHSINGQH